MGSAQQLYTDLSNRNAFKRLNYKTGNILFGVTEKRLCWRGSIPVLFKLFCISTEQFPTGKAAPQAQSPFLMSMSCLPLPLAFFAPSSPFPAPAMTLISTFGFFSSFKVASTYYRIPGMKILKTLKIKPHTHNTVAAVPALCSVLGCAMPQSPLTQPCAMQPQQELQQPRPPAPVPPTAACTGTGDTAGVTTCCIITPPDSTASYWKRYTAGKETAQ